MENKNLFVKVISTSVACGQEISWCHQKPCSVHSCYKYGTLVVELGFVLLYVCLLYFKKRVVFPLWKTSFNNTNFRIFFFSLPPPYHVFFSLSRVPEQHQWQCMASALPLTLPQEGVSLRESPEVVCVFYLLMSEEFVTECLEKRWFGKGDIGWWGTETCLSYLDLQSLLFDWRCVFLAAKSTSNYKVEK